MAGAPSIIATVVFNVICLILTLLAFEYLRLREVDIYAPRSRLPNHQKPDRRFLGWIAQIHFMNDSDIIKLSGFDAYVFVRFLKLCRNLCLYYCFGAAVLLPFYGGAIGNVAVTGFNQLSMANITPDDNILWVSFAFIYIFTFLFMYVFHQEYKNFVVLRSTYFASMAVQMKYTVMVENIPRQCRSHEKLKRLFEEIFPGKVLYANVAVATDQLDKAVKERDLTARKIEDLMGKFAASDGRHIPKVLMVNDKPLCESWYWRYLYHMVSCCFCFSKSEVVDSRMYYNTQLQKMCENVKKMQEEAIAATSEAAGVEYVYKHTLPDKFVTDSDACSVAPDSVVDHLENDIENFNSDTFKPMSFESNDVSNREITPVRLGRLRSCSAPEVYMGRVRSYSGAATTAAYSMMQPPSSQKSNLTATNLMFLSKGIFSNSALAIDRGIQSIPTEFLTKTAKELTDVVTPMVQKLARKFASATGFVTFKTRRAQLFAVNVPVLVRHHPNMIIEPAPDPSDIIWENSSVPPFQIENVCYLTSMMYYTGLFFWSAVLAFMAAMTNLETFARVFPFIDRLNPTVHAVIQGLLPANIMLYFVITVATVMTYVAQKVERHKTRSEVEHQVFKWFYLYLMVNIVMLLVAGSTFDLLHDAINQPSKIVHLIGDSLPTVSVFFINFTVNFGIGAIPVNLLRRIDSFNLFCSRMFFKPIRLTRNGLKNGPFAPVDLSYGVDLPYAMYTLNLVQLYWVIAPAIIPFGAVCFSVILLVYKYQLAFVFQRPHDTGGKFWFDIHYFSMVGLMVSCIVSICYMSTKNGVYQMGLLLPLPAIILYGWRYTEKLCKALATEVPYDAAVHEDDSSHIKQRSMEAIKMLNRNPYDIDDDGATVKLENDDDEDDDEEDVRVVNEYSSLSRHAMNGGGNSSFGSFESTQLMKSDSFAYRRAGISENIAHRANPPAELFTKFAEEFYKQPNIRRPAVIYTYPHRIDDIPLLNKVGTLSEIYLKDIPEGEKPRSYLQDLGHHITLTQGDP